MSSKNTGCGGCGCLFLMAIIVLVALAVTNPSEAAHRKAFAERTPIVRAIFRLQEMMGGAKLQYHDYFVVSIMTAKRHNSADEMPISVGFFGKVYYGSDK